jgi:hypothetical protein
LIPQVWSTSLPLTKKLEASLHLTGYGVHLLLWALTLLYPLVLLLSVRYPSLIALFGIAFIFNATAFAPTAFFAVAQQQLGRRWWRQLPSIFFISALGAGMMLNTLRAALQIFWRRHSVFERTPKFGIVNKGQDWTRRRYQLQLDPIVFVELAFALLNLGTVGLAIYVNNWMIGVYAALFCIGLLFTSGLTMAQAIAVYRGRARQSAPHMTASAG